MKKLIFTFLTFFSLQLFAKGNYMDPCGVYEIEGLFKINKSNHLVLIVNKGATTETQFALGPAQKKYSIFPYGIDDMYGRARIKIETRCRYFCNAKLLSIEKHIEFKKDVQPLFDNPNALKKVIPCKVSKAKN